MANLWTQALTDRLKNLIASGLSTRQIGQQLGLTRNAVIGKSHRLGLRGKPMTVVSLVSLPVKRPREAREDDTPPVVPPCLPSSILSRVDRLLRLKASECRWPIGDPRDRDFHFCCQPRAGVNSAYCAMHKRIAHRGHGNALW
jgi:GcrA cell cycle regulator